MDKVQGTYSATLFESTSNGFKVCRFKENKVNEKSLTITGYFPPLEPDTLYELEGDYIEHPRFGMQFSVHSIRKLLPQDRDMVIRFLSGPLFPGIGEKLATEIVDVYGDDILVKLKADPMMPLHLKRLTPKKKEALILGLTQNGDLDEAIEFFTLHGLSIRTIMKIEKIYGSKALQLIQDNPYRMIDDIDGIGFKSADKLAVSMGYEKDHPLRLQAILVSLVMQLCMSSGDTYITEAALFNAVQGTYTFNETDFEETLNTVVFDGRLSREDTRIYHHSQYMSEVFIAEFFKYFPLSHLNPIDPKEVSEALVAIQNHLNIQYDTIQTESIQTFFSQDVSLITGGPGTGKTTIVLGIIELIRFFSPGSSVLLCAPTGRAAKRLKEITQVDAQTIHSALKWDLETNTFGCNQEDPLAYDILILDEFSMVDNWLMANLLKASASIKKILFIGDKDQLPSVSPGFVIRDFLDSRFFATTELQHIYRQKEGSEVIEVAQAMNHGSFNTTNFNKDVKFYHSSPSQVKTYIIQLIANALDKGYTLNDIQVLVPQYNSVAGIDQLNHFLQQECNPPGINKRELRVGYKIFRENDKILQLKNQPDDYVFNGDIGFIEEIIFANEDENNQNRIIANFDSVIVEYTNESFINISHAYCMSVHKAQGSEYPIVILVALRLFGIMLQRRLYYTGITRASKALILIGEEEAFLQAAKNNQVHERQTYLKQRLEGLA